MIEGPKGTGLSLQKPLQYFSQKMLDFQFFGKKLKTIFLYNSKCQGPQPFMLLIGDIKPYNFCYQSTFCSDHFLAKYSPIRFTRRNPGNQTGLYQGGLRQMLSYQENRNKFVVKKIGVKSQLSKRQVLNTVIEECVAGFPCIK